MEESNKKPLYIPVNTPDYDAYLSGVGATELSIYVFATVVTIMLGVILSQFLNTICVVMLGLSIISFVVITFRRDGVNENFYIKLRILKRFRNSQKKYWYEYFNIYEAPLLKGED